MNTKRRKIKLTIRCPNCGYKGEPTVKYESPYHVWYCPNCGKKQQ